MNHKIRMAESCLAGPGIVHAGSVLLGYFVVKKAKACGFYVSTKSCTHDFVLSQLLFA